MYKESHIKLKRKNKNTKKIYIKTILKKP